jgi:hypothetical protein
MTKNGVQEEDENGVYRHIATNFWYDGDGKPLGNPHYGFTSDRDGLAHVIRLIEKYTPDLVICSTRTSAHDALGRTLWQVTESWFEKNGYIVVETANDPKPAAISYLLVWLCAVRAMLSDFPENW